MTSVSHWSYRQFQTHRETRRKKTETKELLRLFGIAILVMMALPLLYRGYVYFWPPEEKPHQTLTQFLEEVQREQCMRLLTKPVGKWSDAEVKLEPEIYAWLKEQSRTIKTYRDDGHKKSLRAMSEAIESLRHVMQMLRDGDRSAVFWCGFVCILDFCVSMLFFTNGLLLCFVNRLGYTASPALTSAIGRD